MDHRPAIAAVALLACTFLPALVERLPAPAPRRCVDRRRVERIDPLELRGALPLVPCVASGAGSFRAPRGAAALLLGHRIDLDRAPLEELVDLPGVGPGIARRILAAREAGPFTHLEDLRRVRGFGEKRIAALRPFVRIGGAPAGRAAAAR